MFILLHHQLLILKILGLSILVNVNDCQCDRNTKLFENYCGQIKIVVGVAIMY